MYSAGLMAGAILLLYGIPFSYTSHNLILKEIVKKFYSKFM